MKITKENLRNLTLIVLAILGVFLLFSPNINTLQLGYALLLVSIMMNPVTASLIRRFIIKKRINNAKLNKVLSNIIVITIFSFLFVNLAGVDVTIKYVVYYIFPIIAGVANAIGEK